MCSDVNKCTAQKLNADKSFSLGSGRNPANEFEEYKQYFMKEHNKLILLANKQFGLNCWSHSVTKQDLECVDYIDGKYSVAASAIVKIVLKQGTYHEELGFGVSFKLANKTISIVNARQEAKLDALRKAIASFNCDIESEENIEGHKHSPVRNQEASIKTTSFHTPSANHCSTRTLTSPLNSTNVALTSPTVNSPVSSVTEQIEQRDLRAERKRKQQQLQEEYRSRMKLKEKQQVTNKENSNSQFLLNAAVQDEPSFLSTQEVDEMMKSAAVLLKPESSTYRVPLISSPIQNSKHGWAPNNCVKTPENLRNSSMYMNKTCMN